MWNFNVFEKKRLILEYFLFGRLTERYVEQLTSFARLPQATPFYRRDTPAENAKNVFTGQLIRVGRCRGIDSPLVLIKWR